MKKVLFLTITFGVARFIVPVTGAINKADIFKDVAHCFVGGLFGAAIVLTVLKRILHELWPIYSVSESIEGVFAWINKTCMYLWTLAIGLTILEVIAFVLLKSS